MAGTTVRLVSFLGLGGKDGYLPAEYFLPGTGDDGAGDEGGGDEGGGDEGGGDHRRIIATPFLARALAELLDAAAVTVVCTQEAYDKNGEALAAALQEAGRPAPVFRIIPSGGAPDELWEQFETLRTALASAPGEALALDITHGFRAQPFFAAAVVAFARAADPAAPPLRVFYGAFEDRHRHGGRTPIWDLTPFIETVDWARNVALFLSTGRAAPVADDTERLGRALRRDWAASRQGLPPQLDRLGRALRTFGDDLETVRTGSLLLGGFGRDGRQRAEPTGAALHRAVAAARADVAGLPPLAAILDRVEAAVVPLAAAPADLAGPEGQRALAALARLYLHYGRYSEAAATVREGWVSRHGAGDAARPGSPGCTREARAQAEAAWLAEDDRRGRAIAGVRNDIQHAGLNADPRPAASLREQIGRLVEEFAAEAEAG